MRPRSSLITRCYTVVYQPIPDDEGKGYYAHIPALGITTDGETLEEAKDMARDAVEGYIEAAKEIGKPIAEETETEQLEVTI